MYRAIAEALEWTPTPRRVERERRRGRSQWLPGCQCPITEWWQPAMLTRTRVPASQTVVATVSTTTVPTPPASGTSVPGSPTATVAGDPAIYAQGIAVLQAYLDTWREQGLYAATTRYIMPTGDSPPLKQAALDSLKLLSGTIVSWRRYAWVSENQFTVTVTLDLHFPNQDGLAWGEGVNNRYATFIRPDTQAQFLIWLTTSPPPR